MLPSLFRRLNEKKVQRKVILVVAVIILGIIIAVIRVCPPGGCLSSPPVDSKVLIVDQLAVDAQNKTFNTNVESIFKAAGVSYDVVNGTEVTVNFYRDLPSMGYGLILVRSHSGLLFPRDPKNPIYLFTGELYSQQKYQQEQLDGSLSGCAVTASSPAYFCIAPTFVTRHMNGTFQGTVLLLNGCDTLINYNLANAFLLRGAFGFTGLDEYVSAEHMDTAMNRFLEDFVTHGMTLAQSVQDVVEKIGPDPYYHSNFRFYPESGHREALRLTFS